MFWNCNNGSYSNLWFHILWYVFSKICWSKLIGGKLAFGSRGPWLKSPLWRKKFPLSFLSCDLMIIICLRNNSWLCKVIDLWIYSSCVAVLSIRLNSLIKDLNRSVCSFVPIQKLSYCKIPLRLCIVNVQTESNIFHTFSKTTLYLEIL